MVIAWFHCHFKILLPLTFVQHLLTFLTFSSRWWKLNRIVTRGKISPCSNGNEQNTFTLKTKWKWAESGLLLEEALVFSWTSSRSAFQIISQVAGLGLQWGKEGGREGWRKHCVLLLWVLAFNTFGSYTQPLVPVSCASLCLFILQRLSLVPFSWADAVPFHCKPSGPSELSPLGPPAVFL